MKKIRRKLKKSKRTRTSAATTLQTAIAHYNARNWEAADAACRDILRKEPSNHRALNLLAIILTKKADFVLAEKCVRKAIRIKPDEAAYYSNLGLILKEQEKWEGSLQAFDRACTLNPNDAESYYNLGTLHQALKNMEKAQRFYRRANAINPSHIQALCALSNLLSRQPETRPELDKIIAQMEALLPMPENPVREQLYFELARVHDKLGNHDRVFQFLEPANRIFREKYNYEIEGETRLFEVIASSFTRDLLEEKQGKGSEDPAPIFIVGMPRSGTTLVEQILASHSAVAAGGELHYLNTILLKNTCLESPFKVDTIRLPDYSRIDRLPESSLPGLARAYIEAVTPLKAEKQYITDKMPHNFIHIGMISLLFPNCRVIHCRRDPLDNCLSLYMQNFKTLHPYAYSLEEIGRYYAGYNRLMNHWQDLLPGFMHDVQYEKLVRNPERETKKLLDFCGLPWEEGCLQFYKLNRFIRTASEGQADQPLYTTSIGRWKHYVKQLQPLTVILDKAGLH